MKSICVYCGSSTEVGEAYYAAARALGARIAQRGFKLVYGGAHVGLMGALADAALAHGGEVAGVIPRALIRREVAHGGLTEMHEVESMHDRKALMAGLSDAFIALPGGFGTLDELCEIVTWALLEFHAKPVVLVNVDGYYDHLLAFLERAAEDGFIRPRHRALLGVAASVDEALRLCCESA
jgi:uncharacterized protein (TIGR00730 family)